MRPKSCHRFISTAPLWSREITQPAAASMIPTATAPAKPITTYREAKAAFTDPVAIEHHLHLYLQRLVHAAHCALWRLFGCMGHALGRGLTCLKGLWPWARPVRIDLESRVQLPPEPVLHAALVRHSRTSALIHRFIDTSLLKLAGAEMTLKGVAQELAHIMGAVAQGMDGPRLLMLCEEVALCLGLSPAQAKAVAEETVGVHNRRYR